VNGLLVLAGVVALGFASGAGYFFFQAPRVRARTEAEVAAAPSTPEGRLAHGFEMIAAQVHSALVAGRISRQQPWLATHAVATEDPDGRVAVWGIDTDELPHDLAVQEGMVVVVHLPAPRLLAVTHLVGRGAEGVPVFEDAEDVPDAAERLRTLGEWFLRRIATALPRDLPGSSIEVRVGEPAPGAGLPAPSAPD
jgi:hypothetical protein